MLELSMSMDLNAVLRRAVESGASDVHLKVGQPPVLRQDGQLTLLAEVARLEDADLQAVLERVTAATPRRLELFHESGELDLEYSEPGLPRFRVNGFRQRGAVSFAFQGDPEHDRPATRSPRPRSSTSRAATPTSVK
jgi:twitching motility protein PilT